MNKWLLRVGKVLLLLSVLIAVVFLIGYTPDLPVEELKKKYAFDDSQWIDIDGVDIHYRSVGTGVPIILVHGFGGNLRNWEKWTDLLKDKYKVISYDLPGFGLTGPIASRDYRDDNQVAFLHEFKNALGIDTFILAGNSMGGAISWQYVLQHPDDVIDLILLDASGYKSVREDLGEKKTPLGFKLLRYPIFKSVLTNMTPAFVVAKTLRDTYGDPDFVTSDDVDIVRDLMRYPGAREALFDRMNNGVSPPTDRIKEIKTPTLILWGDRDNLIPVSHADRFGKDIDGSSVIIYKGIGHLPMDEHAVQTTNDVIDWLSVN